MTAQAHRKPFNVTKLDVFERPGATVKLRTVPRPGATVTFENGFMVSLFFEGEGETAEVAVFAPEHGGDIVRFMDGEVAQMGCSMDRVQRILDRASAGTLMREYQPPTPPPEMRADA